MKKTITTIDAFFNYECSLDCDITLEGEELSPKAILRILSAKADLQHARKACLNAQKRLKEIESLSNEDAVRVKKSLSETKALLEGAKKRYERILLETKIQLVENL